MQSSLESFFTADLDFLHPGASCVRPGSKSSCVAPSRGPQIQGGSPPPPTTSRGAEWERNKGRKKQTQQVKVKDQARHPQEKHIAFNTGRMRYRGQDAQGVFS
ncbi:unnamed protein product [Boreogadus saida]